jgi:hypothetical protein
MSTVASEGPPLRSLIRRQSTDGSVDSQNPTNGTFVSLAACSILPRSCGLSKTASATT